MCVETVVGNVCDLHVDCYMADCVALLNPTTPTELKEFKEHWEVHMYGVEAGYDQ